MSDHDPQVISSASDAHAACGLAKRKDASMTTDNRTLVHYRIRIGHHDFRVRARDAAEAVELARRQLARELPRLYDVIRTLAESRFQVELAA
jgi:hypothetical protein